MIAGENIAVQSHYKGAAANVPQLQLLCSCWATSSCVKTYDWNLACKLQLFSSESCMHTIFNLYCRDLRLVLSQDSVETLYSEQSCLDIAMLEHAGTVAVHVLIAHYHNQQGFTKVCIKSFVSSSLKLQLTDSSLVCRIEFTLQHMTLNCKCVAWVHLM